MFSSSPFFFGATRKDCAGMPRECQICCGLPRRVYACSACGYVSCRSCCQRVVEDSPAACVACGAAWTGPECQTRLGASHYRKVYLKAIRERLLARELARMHTATLLAQRERQRRFLRSEIIRLSAVVRNHRREDATHELRVAVNELRVAQATMRILIAPHAATSERGSASIPLRCPRAGCDGVVQGGEQCVTCGARVCVACGRDAHEGECRNEDVRSIELVRRTSRPCANCGVPTVRSEGCPVMWCSRCHVFWHWERRVVIETRGATVPHNPDHRRWVASQRGRMREVHGFTCGGFSETPRLHAAILSDLDERHPIPPVSAVALDDATVFLAALDSVVAAQSLRPSYPRVATDDALLQMRVAYLLGDFASEEAYSVRIDAQERTTAMKREVGEILETFVLSGLDVVQRFAHDGPDRDTVALAAENLRSLRRLTNVGLAVCSKRWGRKTPTLTDDWTWRVPYARRA